MTAESIRTTANVTLDKTDAGFTITAVHLEVTAKIPGADQQVFETAAAGHGSYRGLRQSRQRAY